MIHALRDVPRGQNQHFEPQEQQHREEQDRHIHLHIHLNLTFRARQKRPLSTPDSTRVARIFAAFVGASSLALRSECHGKPELRQYGWIRRTPTKRLCPLWR